MKLNKETTMMNMLARYVSFTELDEILESAFSSELEKQIAEDITDLKNDYKKEMSDRNEVGE